MIGSGVYIRLPCLFLTVSAALMVSFEAASQSICDVRSDPHNICEDYQKPDAFEWGDIYRAMFDRTGFGKSYALVIGVGDYDHWTSLKAPSYDAKRVRDFLINEAGFDRVVTLTNGAATKRRIEQLMEEVFPAALGQDDRFLFYYSGHGTERNTYRGMVGYLPLKPARESGYAAMISMDDLTRWSRLLGRVRQSLFLLDACFSGLAGVERKAALDDKRLDRLSQRAHYLVTAGTAEEESFASVREWGGSLFTDAFVRGAGGRADAATREFPADGLVSLKELVKYIEDRIDAESSRYGFKMTPQIRDLDPDNAGEFFFISKAHKNRRTGSPATASLSHGMPTERKGQRDIEVMDLVMHTLRRSNVRAAPSATGERLATLDIETAVQVTGKVTGEPWFRVALSDGRTGYMWDKLLGEGTQVAVGTYPSTSVKALEIFRDCGACPEMVALPGGMFTMGSPPDEDGRYADEGPQRKVTVEPFAIGKYEVTVGEYRRFVEATGRSHKGGMWVWTGSEWKQDPEKDWRDPGLAQTDRHPVVGVSWEDARAYARWLSGHAGQAYRLPAEAEWEYAARAGTTTRFAFGDDLTDRQANFGGNVGKTTEVGSYPANSWGLYDMHGNVWEWVEDLWHETYDGAPRDGSAWTQGGDQSRRVLRGGSWDYTPRSVRSAYRIWNLPVNRIIFAGFRVARTY